MGAVLVWPCRPVSRCINSQGTIILKHHASPSPTTVPDFLGCFYTFVHNGVAKPQLLFWP